MGKQDSRLHSPTDKEMSEKDGGYSCQLLRRCQTCGYSSQQFGNKFYSGNAIGREGMTKKISITYQ